MSHKGGKREQKLKDLAEVEMAATSDGAAFRDAQRATDPEEEYAQPKGVQTRLAIAKHLATKLKIDGPQALDAGAVFS